MGKPKQPSSLAEAGRALWSEVVAKYDLRPDELVTLEDYCALTDEIVDVAREWSELGRPRMTKGSMGQLVEHPLPKRITDLRMKRNALSRQLSLPDEAAGAAVNAQRKGGETRWANAHGASA